MIRLLLLLSPSLLLPSLRREAQRLCSWHVRHTSTKVARDCAAMPDPHPAFALPSPPPQANITRAAERTADASVQIARAERSQRSARSKWCFLLVIAMIVVGLLMLIILA